MSAAPRYCPSSQPAATCPSLSLPAALARSRPVPASGIPSRCLPQRCAQGHESDFTGFALHHSESPSQWPLCSASPACQQLGSPSSCAGMQEKEPGCSAEAPVRGPGDSKEGTLPALREVWNPCTILSHKDPGPEEAEDCSQVGLASSPGNQ